MAVFTTLFLLVSCLVIPGGTVSEAASKKLKVSSPKTVTVGSSIKIKTNVKATFKSSNKKIATVSSKGVVKGKKAGKVKITVTSKSNKNQKKTVKITVKKKQPATTEKPTTQVVPKGPTTEQPTTADIKPNPGPTTEATTAQSTTEQQTTEKPTTENPTTETPTEEPTTEEPTTETPSTEDPSTEPYMVGIEATCRGDKIPSADILWDNIFAFDIQGIYSDGSRKQENVNAADYREAAFKSVQEIDGKKYAKYEYTYNGFKDEVLIEVVEYSGRIPYCMSASYLGKIEETQDKDDYSKISLNDFYVYLHYFDSDEKIVLDPLECDINYYNYASIKRVYIIYDYYFYDDSGNKLYNCYWSFVDM